ncbi:ABC transporter permease [Desulfitibacter alkalitolerans]|uniref:ABC transporter permease n=1 Tax=Desulfitibacter alkalitolerans TaxID=264641 RepID=UPI000685D85D|nr:ABC transporter permease [Desulfitibacter alkalitolerans]
MNRDRIILYTGLTIVTLLLLLSLIGPYLNKWTYYEQTLQRANEAPGWEYWFGTDALGRDLFTRVWVGLRISFIIGIAASLISVVVGTVYGAIAGYFGGILDEVMMKLVEILYSIPFLIYVILLLLIMEPGIKTIIIALIIVCWLGTARIVRGEIVRLKEMDFVLAAHSIGASNWRIIFYHLIPGAAGSIIIMLTITIPEVILAEAILSFLGLGVSAPKASLGYLINDGFQSIRSYPYQLVFPAAVITLAMLGFNLTADGLRSFIDPNVKK